MKYGLRLNGVDALVALFDSKLRINEGIKVTLSTNKADIVSTRDCVLRPE